MCNSQLNELKFGMKNNTEVNLKLASNFVGESYDENNFSHSLLLTNTQVLRLFKDFGNDSSANIKSSKTELDN